MRKKTIKKMVLTLLFVMMLAMSATCAHAAIYRKTTVKVNLRSKAGSTDASTIITTIAKGKTVELVGKSTKYPTWYYINYNGKKGFVQSQYLTTISSDDEEDGDDGEDDSSETVTATVAVNLNFRRSAKISSSNIIRVLPKGTKVTVVSETSANWVKIRTSDGTTGYVYAGYFTSTTSSSSSAVYQTTATALNLRRTAKVANGNVITVIPANKKVRILSATGNWYRVQYSSYTGYVKSGYFKNETKTASVTETVRVNLNLRSSAKIKSGNIKLTIPKGKKVTVLKEVSGNWLYVKYGSTKGYVKAGYFTSDSSTSTSSSSRKTTANVRIRSSRSTSSSSNILDVIPRGSSVKVKKTYDGWYKVSYNGITGYVSSDYVS